MNTVEIESLVQKTRQCNPATLGRPLFRYIDISSIDRQDKRIAKAQIICSNEAPSRARKLVSAGDVLVSTVRPNLNAVALVSKQYDSEIASTGFCVLRPNKNLIEPTYLYYFVQTERFIQHLVQLATGAGYPAVSDADILETEIPRPPLPEQKRIAALLDKADRLRRSRRFAQELSSGFLQSAFLEMFGDPLTNLHGWERVRLREIAERFSDGPFGSNLKSSHYKEQGIRVLRLQNIGVGELINTDKAYIAREHFESLIQHRCIPGDIIVGTMGDPNLRACILPPSIPEALNKADCVQVRADVARVYPEYICWLLNLPSTLLLASGMILGQTRSRISMGRLAELVVPIAPLVKQEKFVTVVHGVERLRAQQREAERQAEHLFQTLLHRAFSN